MVSRNPSPKKTKGDKFPLTIKAGSSSVKIYREPRDDGSIYYKLSYHLGGKRHRPSFADLDEAKNEAQAKAAQLSRGDIDAMQLNGKDRLTYGRALDAVKTLGMPLDAAAIDYAEARKILKNHSLQDAARFYMRHHGQGITGKSVSEALEAFLEAKSKAQRSAVYLKDIRLRVGTFAKAFSCEVRQLSTQDIADWLECQKVTARSINNTALLLRTFFGFCQTRQWLSKDVDLMERVTRQNDVKSDIEIFTPKELRELLHSATPRLATAIAIQAFAGVRTAELMRMTWGDTERRKGYIEVSASKAKTASRRLIPIHENLASWIQQGEKENDRVWPVIESEFYEQLAKLAEKAGVPWKKNALRHSFISYRVAEAKDIAATSIEAGNSPKIIFQSYRELVTEDEGKEWFGIVPAEAPKNLIQIHAAA
jgi:integrase